MAASPALAEISSTLDRVAAEQGRSVVGVGRGWRVGSGAVIAPDRVLTIAHRAADTVTVTFADGREADGEPVAADHDLDLAVVAVDTGDASALEWTAHGDSLGVGTPVVGLGNPGGRGLRATLGFVAAADRGFRGPRGRRVSGAVEHTAPLPRGSAGGPLLDVDGALIGVNLLRLDGGLIVAPSVAGGLRQAVDRLVRGEQPARPRLGVAVAPPRVARRMRRAVGLPERDGVLVRAVEDGSAAARAQIARGDLIIGVSGHEVGGIDALHRALDDAATDGALRLTVVRGTDEREVEVELGGRR
ncbi:MAG TPA: S1C family serine protease [Solirubrobacterales bacterium]|nr:S1C family serine protease [Solirubrobacterales bacterium]